MPRKFECLAQGLRESVTDEAGGTANAMLEGVRGFIVYLLSNLYEEKEYPSV